MNILNDLEKIRKVERIKSEEALSTELVDGVKLLLETNNSDERNLLRNLSLDNHIRTVERRKGYSIELEKFESEYGTLYTTDEIKKICQDYYLRFLPIEQYKGNITNELPSVILRFCNEYKISTTDSYLKRQFSIVAPAENFELQNKPKDPLLFYKVGHANGEDLYKLIYKWGNDFTPFRLVEGFKYKSILNFGLYYGILTTLFTVILCGLCGASTSALIGSSLTLGVLAGSCAALYIADDKKLSKYTWNNQYK
jgi:hypothetical protein